jgi:hypothetical protein
MADEAFLAAKARDAVLSGRLPAVGGEPVAHNQMELEIECNRHGATPGLDRYQLHTKCFAARELERKKSGAD